ncbi:MAG TPA: oligosaccharide flippase family protein [Chitinophagales bacterium]|nr:oligosaccharide flippase family protein [Chitinophagales bacterium]
MRRKFATNLLFLFAANLLVKPFWILGIDRVVQNKVGAAEYGTYFAVFNYSFLLSIVLDFGINNFNNRAISRNNKRAGEYLLNLLLLKSILAILYFALTFISAMATGYSEQQMTMLLFLAINQILLSGILYFRSNIAALQHFKIDSLLSILDRLLTIAFCLVLLYVPFFKEGFNILWFIYAQTLALLITAVVAFVVIFKKTVLSFDIWKFKFARLILLKSFPFALLALLMGIYYRVDAVMIERMLPDGAREAGIYAASFRLLDALNMFGYLFATLLLPMFAGMIRRKESVIQLVKFGSELMFVFSVTAGIGCYFFRNEIMLLLYRDSDPYWAGIFGWLMLNFIPMSSVYIFGTLLTANGSLKVLNYIALGGMVLNVSLNLFLIPEYGAFGATVATLLTQMLVAVLHVMAANRQFNLDYRFGELGRLLGFSIACLGVGLLTSRLPLIWMLGLPLAITLCLLAGIAAKLLPFKQFVALLRAKAAS